MRRCCCLQRQSWEICESEVACPGGAISKVEAWRLGECVGPGPSQPGKSDRPCGPAKTPFKATSPFAALDLLDFGFPLLFTVPHPDRAPYRSLQSSKARDIGYQAKALDTHARWEHEKSWTSHILDRCIHLSIETLQTWQTSRARLQHTQPSGCTVTVDIH
jgi:hypothetical protein